MTKEEQENSLGQILAQSINSAFNLSKTLIGVKRCREDVILPVFTEGNAGADLRVLTPDKKPVEILPNGTYTFKTGIKMDIPKGYYIEVVPRSSTGIKKNLRLMNTCGILDSSWKGETLVAIHNFGKEPVLIENNERLCQMIVHRVYPMQFTEVEDVGTSERGEKGIGSTGRF